MICRCYVAEEIGRVITSTTSGDGGTAAVIVKDGVNLGVVYIEYVISHLLPTESFMKFILCRNKRQAEAICDIITSVVLNINLNEVSQMLLGRDCVQYIKDVLK